MLQAEPRPGCWWLWTRNCSGHTNTDERSKREKVSGIITDKSSENRRNHKTRSTPRANTDHQHTQGSKGET